MQHYVHGDSEYSRRPTVYVPFQGTQLLSERVVIDEMNAAGRVTVKSLQ